MKLAVTYQRDNKYLTTIVNFDYMCYSKLLDLGVKTCKKAVIIDDSGKIIADDTGTTNLSLSRSMH